MLILSEHLRSIPIKMGIVLQMQSLGFYSFVCLLIVFLFISSFQLRCRNITLICFASHLTYTRMWYKLLSLLLQSNSQTMVPGTSGEKSKENQTTEIPSAMNWTLSQVEEWLNAKILRKDMFLSTQYVSFFFLFFQSHFVTESDPGAEYKYKTISIRHFVWLFFTQVLNNLKKL